MASQDKQAIAAVQRFARAGYNVDAKNQDHIRAYILARQQCARPRAETVLAIIGSAKQTLSTGPRLQSDCILVPKANILGSADGTPASEALAPQWLQEWLCLKRSCGALSLFRSSRVSSFFICDAPFRVARLGKRLNRLTFEEVASRVLTNRSLRHQPGKVDEEAHSSHPEARSLPRRQERQTPWRHCLRQLRASLWSRKQSGSECSK